MTEIESLEAERRKLEALRLYLVFTLGLIIGGSVVWSVFVK